MELTAIADSIAAFAKQNTLAAAVAALVLAYFIWRKTRLVAGLVILVVILGSVWYFIMHLSGIGSSQKDRMLKKGERQTEQVR